MVQYQHCCPPVWQPQKAAINPNCIQIWRRALIQELAVNKFSDCILFMDLDILIYVHIHIYIHIFETYVKSFSYRYIIFHYDMDTICISYSPPKMNICIYMVETFDISNAHSLYRTHTVVKYECLFKQTPLGEPMELLNLLFAFGWCSRQRLNVKTSEFYFEQIMRSSERASERESESEWDRASKRD